MVLAVVLAVPCACVFLFRACNLARFSVALPLALRFRAVLQVVGFRHFPLLATLRVPLARSSSFVVFWLGDSPQALDLVSSRYNTTLKPLVPRRVIHAVFQRRYATQGIRSSDHFHLPRSRTQLAIGLEVLLSLK